MIEVILFVTDFLDVFLYLQNESNKPFRKQNVYTVYVNIKSGYLEHVLN